MWSLENHDWRLEIWYSFGLDIWSLKIHDWRFDMWSLKSTIGDLIFGL